MEKNSFDGDFLINKENIKLEEQLNTEVIIKNEMLENNDGKWIKTEDGQIKEILEDSFTMKCERIKNEVVEDIGTMEILEDSFTMKCDRIKTEVLEDSDTVEYGSIKNEVLEDSVTMKPERIHENLITINYENIKLEKRFSCYVCNKSFSERSYLVDHQRIHSGGKAFSCDICNKSFNQRAHLADHKRTHTGEKPFACEVCNKTFSQRSSLTRHKRKAYT